MIECPFCGEQFPEDELVYEFRWGDIVNYYYNHRKLVYTPPKEYQDRTFYVTMNFDRRGNPVAGNCNSVINPEKHVGLDPLCSEDNEWTRVTQLLRQKGVFEVESDDDYPELPTRATFLPLKKQRGKGYGTEGVSTGTYCPICEQQLKPQALMVDQEIRIVLVGRPGSGKTVYVTQLISELMKGRLATAFRIEAANRAVDEHYNSNKRRLQAFSSGFVMATNPSAVQEPYIYVLENGKSRIRLVIQDIAGEDSENRIKYANVVRKADMMLFFVDPWHISEVRSFHAQAQDATVPLVDQSTSGKYQSLNGIFLQMMDCVDRRFIYERDQLAAVMLVKGDYLNPPMLSKGAQPECQMMSHPVSFGDVTQMEFDLGMRSSFVRQCLNEWSDTCAFVHDLEGKYSAPNTRYFVVSALGKSTHLKSRTDNGGSGFAQDFNDPGAQFSVGSAAQPSVGKWNYDEQVLDSAAQPENVIDPVFWCLSRRNVKF